MRDGGVGKKLAVAYKQTIKCDVVGVGASPPALFRVRIVGSTSFWRCLTILSGFSEITKARYTTKLRVNNVTCGDSFRVDAADCTLKPDSHDGISLGIFSRDAARAAKV